MVSIFGKLTNFNKKKDIVIGRYIEIEGGTDRNTLKQEPNDKENLVVL